MAATEDMLRALRDVVGDRQSSMGARRVDELGVGSRAARTAVIASSAYLFWKYQGPGTRLARCPPALPPYVPLSILSPRSSPRKQ